MAFAGISVSPARDDYVASVSLVSDHDGSIIGTKTSSSSPLSSLTKTIEGMLLELQDVKLQGYVFSISSALNADRIFDFHKAMESLKTSSPSIHPTLMHGETYTIGHTAKDEITHILFVDFISSAQFSTSFLQARDDNGKRQADIIHEERISISATPQSTPLDIKLFKSAISSGRSQEPIERIVINNFASQAEFQSDIEAAIAAEYPDIPIAKTTLESIAEAAALFLRAKSLLPPKGRILAQYGMPLPVSIASPTGSIITLIPSDYRIPCDQSVTLTNSKDDQESATIRLLLGNHPLAKDNLERAVISFKDLKPLPKGKARIRVNIKVSHLDGWREAATITVSQEGGPSKSYLFPRMFSGLSDDAYDVYEVSSKREANLVEFSDDVVGELPESNPIAR